MGRKFWYYVSLRGEKTGNFLVYEDSEETIRRKYAWTDKKIMVSQVNWSAVTKLTGCIKRPIDDEKDFADAGLMFDYHGVIVTVMGG